MKVEITKEEQEVIITQLTARLDHFKNLIKVAGKGDDMIRIEEIINYIKPIKSFINRLYDNLWKA